MCDCGKCNSQDFINKKKFIEENIGLNNGKNNPKIRDFWKCKLVIKWYLDLLFKNVNDERIKEPEEMFLNELWDNKHKISGRYDPRQISSMIIDGHKRLIEPIYCIIFTLLSLTFLLSDKLVLQPALKKISIIIFAIFLIEVVYLALPNFIVKEFQLLPIIYIFPLLLLLFLIIYNLKKTYKKFYK